MSARAIIEAVVKTLLQRFTARSSERGDCEERQSERCQLETKAIKCAIESLGLLDGPLVGTDRSEVVDVAGRFVIFLEAVCVFPALCWPRLHFVPAKSLVGGIEYRVERSDANIDRTRLGHGRQVERVRQHLRPIVLLIQKVGVHCSSSWTLRHAEAATVLALISQAAAVVRRGGHSPHLPDVAIHLHRVRTVVVHVLCLSRRALVLILSRSSLRPGIERRVMIEPDSEAEIVIGTVVLIQEYRLFRIDRL